MWIHTLFAIATCVIFSLEIVDCSHLLNCNVPRNFTIDIDRGSRAILYDSELTVRLNEDSPTIFNYPNINSVSFEVNNVIVTFKGYMIINNALDQRVFTQPELITENFSERISGIAERSIVNSTDSTIHDCRLVLLPIDATQYSIPLRIVNDIRRYAESCVELDVCGRIVSTKNEDIIVQSSSSGNISGLLSIYRDPLDPTTTNQLHQDSSNLSVNDCTQSRCKSSGPLQSAINKLVDFALLEIIEKLRETNGGTITVPNIVKEFSTGSGIFKTNGRFEAIDGTFRDLTTIQRSSDAILSHEGLKFLASCSFGLKIAHLNYDRYRLKYGIIKVNGKMSGDIDGTSLAIVVAADYTQVPCKLNIERLEITEIGKMKINLTGLGPLNTLVSKLLNWVSEKWQDEIVHTIENKVRKAVESRLSNFDCERFRP